MANKTNKNLVIGITIAAVAVIAIIVGIVIAVMPKNGNSNDGTDVNDDTGIVETEDDAEGIYSDIDVVIDFGDYEAMETQAKAIQDGEMLGAVVQIDGIVSHPMNKYSIVEENESGSKIGTEFIIEGVDESEYPQDGERVIITGEVVEKQPLYFIIQALPQYVERVVETTEIEE